MRVHEASDGLCLATKLLHSVASQPHLQDFDGGFSLQMNMLAEIHIGVATLSNQTYQAIVMPTVARIKGCLCYHIIYIIATCEASPDVSFLNDHFTVTNYCFVSEPFIVRYTCTDRTNIKTG